MTALGSGLCTGGSACTPCTAHLQAGDAGALGLQLLLQLGEARLGERTPCLLGFRPLLHTRQGRGCQDRCWLVASAAGSCRGQRNKAKPGGGVNPDRSLQVPAKAAGRLHGDS